MLVLASLSFTARPQEGGLPPEVLLLAKIKLRAAENLSGLPNYTCLQSIERYRRRAPTRKAELVDTLRLEVALVGGKELFAYPGGEGFEDREPSELAPGGAFGNGAFALHAKSVFLSNSATFTHAGETTREGRRLIRFNYSVPQMLSGYTLKVGPVKGIAGYHGSFWVDAETLDLVRLEVTAHDIPSHVPLKAADTAMEYARARIGHSAYLLAHKAEMTLVDLAGNESRNVTSFSGCRQYAGESVLNFGEPPPSAAPQAAGPKPELRLPGGVLLETELQTALEAGKSAIGDEVSAVLSHAVKLKGVELLPKGAVMTGRLLRIERRVAARDYLLVAIAPLRVQTSGSTGRLRAALEEVGNPWKKDAAVLAAGDDVRIENYRIRVEGVAPAGSSLFYVRGSGSRVPRGFRLVWRTGDPEREEQGSDPIRPGNR
jgi:hypothetical protein